jgi:hypothetical protein
MQPLASTQIRYIKLGAGGRWVDPALERGEVHFGYRTIPHEPCQAGDWATVERLLIEQGRSPAKAKDGLRELRDFYNLGVDCLWITFARRQLWWAFAEPAVTWLGPDEQGQGARSRKTANGWRNTDLQGNVLTMDGLSSRLTQVAAYRQTLCSVQHGDYLLRRINGEEEPILARAREARQAMTLAAADMIAGLHWADCETMVDLIFARSGWQRVSRVGGTQADVDLILEQPTTGELAFVQVKARATRAVLTKYIALCRASGAYDRMFFVCPDYRGGPTPDADAKLHLWVGQQLAEMAIKAGLYDWLIARSA